MLKKGAKLRAAAILRRSAGEEGTTKNQLTRIMPKIIELEKSGAIRKMNRGIRGKDINEKERYNPNQDLKGPGDFYNEGKGVSGFKTSDRGVLAFLLQQLRDDVYDIVLLESMDRLARDYGAISHLAYDLWTEDGKVFYSLTEEKGLGTGVPQEEAIINTLMTWGGEAKKTEIRKSISAMDEKLNRGYMGTLSVELAGSKPIAAQRSKPIPDYRQFWKLTQAFGENDKGFVRKPADIGKQFKKDHRWAQLWYQKMKVWNQLGVLEKWFDLVDALNAYILSGGAGGVQQPTVSYKQKDVKNILKAATGWLNYPAGGVPSEKYPENKKYFIQFPYPLDVGLNELALTDNAQIVEGWDIIKTPLTEIAVEELLPAQKMKKW